MGSQDEIRMHGSRHCPGGSDPIPAACLKPRLPTVYSSGANHDLADGIGYGSGILFGTAASFDGLADDIFHANDEIDGTGDFFMFDGEVCHAYNLPKAISYEFGVRLVGTDIDPAGSLVMFLLCPLDLGGADQEWIWEGDALAVKAAEATPTFRLTGEAIMATANFYDVDTATRNANLCMGAIVQECGVGGGDVSMTSMWSRFTAVTHIYDVEDFHA